MAAPIKAVGPKSDKLWRQAIMLAVNRVSQDGKTKHLDILAHRLVKSAAEGDIAALREIGDRMDGKPTQVIAGDEDAPLTIRRIEVVVIGTDTEAGGPAGLLSAPEAESV